MYIDGEMITGKKIAHINHATGTVVKGWSKQVLSWIDVENNIIILFLILTTVIISLNFQGVHLTSPKNKKKE